jgi:hypothetical protein
MGRQADRRRRCALDATVGILRRLFRSASMKFTTLAVGLAGFGMRGLCIRAGKE